MIPDSSFQDNSEAAHAIYDHNNSDGLAARSLTLRPYSRYQPGTTEWWLVPSTNWPAYHHGKLFVWQTPFYSAEPNLLYVGYYVEHGIGADIQKLVGAKKKFVMQESWYWHEFVLRAKNGEIDATIEQVSAKTACPVWVLLKAQEANHARDVEIEPKLPNQPPSLVELVAAPKKKGFELAKRDTGILQVANDAADFVDLAQRLERVHDFSYFWIDLLIGIRLRYGATTGRSTWDARSIWQKALAPWMAYVR